MPDAQNARRHRALTEVAALVLQWEGVPATVKPFRKISESLALDVPELGDIQGIEDVSVIVRSSVALSRLSEGVNRARQIAEREGKSYGIVIQRRADASSAHHFVILELGDFARLLGERVPAEDAAS